MCHTVFARGFATTSVATHLTLNLGFPIIRLSQPGGCIDPTGSLAERQRRSPRGCSTATGNGTLDPTNGAGRSQDCATYSLGNRAEFRRACRSRARMTPRRSCISSADVLNQARLSLLGNGTRIYTLIADGA